MRAKSKNAGWLFIFIAIGALMSGCGSVNFKSFNKSDQTAAQSLTGYIRKPEGVGPFPAVVILPGCSGMEQKESTMADTLVKNGYVSLIVDSFSPRGLPQGVCNNPGRLDPLIRAQDAYGALIHLQTLPFVDPARIALIGWSHGGWSVLTAVDSVTYSNYPEATSQQFRGVVAYYPPCGPWSNYPTTFTTDILLLIGDSDDWAPSKYCESMIKNLSKESKPVELVLYPGAFHAFDSYGSLRTYLGYTLGHNQSAAEDSKKRTLQFLKEHFN